MKHFIKTVLVLVLTSALFAETETSAPDLSNTDAQQIVDNTKPEISNENDIPFQEDASTVDIGSATEGTSTAEEVSEEEPLEAIRDIRPAVDLPLETWQITTIAGILLILLLTLIYLIRKRRGQRSGISIIPPDPYHKALQELESALQLIQRLDQRPFATGITDAVRGYLAAVFSLPAPECTTEEVLEQLPNVALLTEELRENITYLLQQCDLAKFTKLQFEQPERLKLYHQAKEFILSSDKLIQLQNANTSEQ